MPNTGHYQWSQVSTRTNALVSCPLPARLFHKTDMVDGSSVLLKCLHLFLVGISCVPQRSIFVSDLASSSDLLTPGFHLAYQDPASLTNATSQLCPGLSPRALALSFSLLLNPPLKLIPLFSKNVSQLHSSFRCPLLGHSIPYQQVWSVLSW